MFTGHDHARAGAARITSSIGRISVLAALAALALGFIPVSPSSAEELPVATGTWTQHPTGGTEYQAAVQQPINTSNTSNWSSKSKGGIPVMFKLSSRPTAAAFESIGSDLSTENDFAFVSFTPSDGLTFGGIHQLSTAYDFTLGNCHGGSLRWQVRTSATQSVFIYYGTAPGFADCTSGGADQSGVDMADLTDARYDTSQYPGGTFYDTHAHAVQLLGGDPVLRASLVLDSGWGGDQQATISNTSVNGNSYDFDSSGGGAFTPTCELPDATIEVTKTAGTGTGDVNEAAVQGSLADSGNAFRVVDCKYQYVLSIPSLSGKGTYEAEIHIDGTAVPTPSSPGGEVKFDIK